MQDEFFAKNKALWDGAAKINARSRFYDVDAFKRGACSLKEIELRELGDVAGKDLLHLQCHFGQDTLSWARHGARVTGLDLSSDAIEIAEGLSRELAIPARFVCANVYDLDQVLADTYDIVFLSYGWSCWLPDLPRFAALAAQRLRPGGILYAVEFHPVFSSLHETRFEPFTYPYFPAAEPEHFTWAGTYADPTADLNRDGYEWAHTIGDVVSALLDAGLRLEFLHEFPYCPYDLLPYAVETEPGRYMVTRGDVALPLIFSLQAVRT